MKKQQLNTAITKLVGEVEILYSSESTSDTVGLSTGFTDLDCMTSGLRPGQLIVVAGRPSMGKTSFVLNIAGNVAVDQKKCVGILNMTMTDDQISQRFVSSRGCINGHALVTGNFEHDDDWSRMTHGLGWLCDANIELISSPGEMWTAESVRRGLLGPDNHIDQDPNENKPDLLIIDGVHNLDIPAFESAYDRNALLGEQIRQLKKLALELSIPIIITSPVNRELESRPNKRPLLKDLRDLGLLEDIADVVLFVYRDELYNYDSPDRGKAEIIVAKNSLGPVGRIDLIFRGEYGRFDNYSSGSY